MRAHIRTGYITVKDSTAPYVKERWLGTFGLFCIYCLRVYMINGWYIVTYGKALLSLCNPRPPNHNQLQGA